MTAALAGFALGLSLIIAIGAQNAFVLRHGIRGTHVFAICLTCAASDAVLIAIGVGGFGKLIETLPWLDLAMRLLGSAFLIWYGLKHLRSAWQGGHHLDPSGNGDKSLKSALLTCLALTWLNPHVYVDTVGLIGSVSTHYEGQAMQFALGAITASFVFFFALGYGAGLLRPWFARPRSWQILDGLIALTMFAIAAKLLIE
ncbi:MAG: LysE/ArgO family amino acid transporter [Deltaproteobacteria bacterium]